MRYVWLALACLFLLVGVGGAELTDPEKAEARRLSVGVKAFYDTQDALRLALAYTGADQAYPELYDALHTHYLAEGALVDVFWMLLETPNWEVTLTGTPQLPPYTEWLVEQRARPRADKLAEAWAALDLLQQRLGELSALVETARTKEPGNTALSNIALTYLPKAVANFTLNRSLPWADPLPAYWPKVVGPHGDYDEAQWRHVKSAHYLSLAGFRGWEACAPLARTQTAQVFTAALQRSVISRSLLDNTLRNANVALLGEPADRISLAFEVMRRDLDDLGEKFWNVQNQLLLLVSYNPEGLAKFMSIVGDAWRHEDRGVWQMLVIESRPGPQ